MPVICNDQNGHSAEFVNTAEVCKELNVTAGRVRQLNAQTQPNGTGRLGPVYVYDDSGFMRPKTSSASDQYQTSWYLSGRVAEFTAKRTPRN